MCLAIPGKIVSIHGNIAKVDYGDGTIRKADISLVNVSVGEYIIVHAGFAIQVLDKKEAEETLMLFKKILEADNA
ncbi:MAG: HypC/HybG/HupF family hydrogenase formation chaperone [Thermoplasmata archaeon]|nr:MAG: HypC/HybG/HupF family hydrogenase formation chaperone [Thermoplasmata archaeon]